VAELRRMQAEIHARAKVVGEKCEQAERELRARYASALEDRRRELGRDVEQRVRMEAAAGEGESRAEAGGKGAGEGVGAGAEPGTRAGGRASSLRSPAMSPARARVTAASAARRAGPPSPYTSSPARHRLP
jgi:hypothetical protein